MNPWAALVLGMLIGSGATIIVELLILSTMLDGALWGGG